MAHKRRSTKTQSNKSSARAQRTVRVSHEEKLRLVSKHYAVDPDNKRTVAKKYRSLIHAPLYLQKKVDKSRLAELKKRGFFVTHKGVIVDGPRNVHRQPIKGARTRITTKGVVVSSVKRRRDYVIGFTTAERKAFAKDPDGFRKKKIAEIQTAFPLLKKHAKRMQVRLQWGAYQAQKDFSPNYFTKAYFAKVERGERKIDKLTGLHIVIHIPKKRKVKSNAKRRKNRRS